MSDGEYARVYHTVVDDPKFIEVYDNDAALATWVRLLIIADQAWPASASLPASAKRRIVTLLERVGLVDLQPGWRYRIHGLDNERTERSESARRAAAMRWHSGGNAGASGEVMPSKAEQEQSKAGAEQPAGDPADDYWNLTGKYPNEKVLAWIDSLTGEFGADAVVRSLGTCHQQDASTTTLLGRVQDVLRRGARQLDRAEKVAELARIEANRPPKGVNVPILIARHNHGAHADEPDANCPPCRRSAA